MYDFIREQTKDPRVEGGFDFPVEYMFKDVPKALYGNGRSDRRSPSTRWTASASRSA